MAMSRNKCLNPERANDSPNIHVDILYQGRKRFFLRTLQRVVSLALLLFLLYFLFFSFSGYFQLELKKRKEKRKNHRHYSSGLVLFLMVFWAQSILLWWGYRARGWFKKHPRAQKKIQFSFFGGGPPLALFLSASGIWINLRTALKSLCRGTTVCVAVGCGGESAGERKKGNGGF